MLDVLNPAAPYSWRFAAEGVRRWGDCRSRADAADAVRRCVERYPGPVYEAVVDGPRGSWCYAPHARVPGRRVWRAAIRGRPTPLAPPLTTS